MALKLEGVASDDKPPEPCARCGSPSECEIWETKVCYLCAVDWGSKAPTYADIHAKHGPEADAPASYRKFTQAWVELFQHHKAAS